MNRTPRKSAAQWAELVTEYSNGSQSERDFCTRHGIKLVTLRKWRYHSRPRIRLILIILPPGLSKSTFVIPLRHTKGPYYASARISAWSVRHLLKYRPWHNLHWRCTVDASRWNAEYVFLYRDPVDMRKGAAGLAALVSLELGRNPADRSLYVFLNRARNKIKLLVWHLNGYWVLYSASS